MIYTFTRAVQQLKEKYSGIKGILVIPYKNFRLTDKTLFDDIINSNTSNSNSYTGYKTAIPKRNRYLAENISAANYYVNHISGGAYNTYQLAEKKKLEIINICYEMKKQKYERSEIMQTKLITVTTELITFACLCEKPSYPYEIAKFIEEHSQQSAASQNAVFTALFALREKGYVKSEEIVTGNGRTREIFSILPEGVEYYENFLEEYQNHIREVNSVLSFVSRF